MKTIREIADDTQRPARSLRRVAKLLGFTKRGRDYHLTAHQERLLIAKLRDAPGKPPSAE